MIENNQTGLYSQDDLDKSKKKLDEAKKRRDFVDKIEQGNYSVLSFYDWIIENSNDSDEIADAKKAIEALNMYTDKIDLDNLNDATNINNVKSALNYLKQINGLRRNDENFKNLSDLKTNHVIMAMAISNAAHSIDGHLRHFLEVPGYYNRLYAENLAYTHGDPFDGWYYREKDAYNYLKNKYDDFNPYENLTQDRVNEIYSKFEVNSVGHYLNIVKRDAETVGIGRDTTPEKVGPFGSIYALNFSTESDAKKSVSIDDYIKRYDDFISYIDRYESRKGLEDAQKEYEKIKNELNNPSIDQYKEKINEANKSIENAKEKLKQRQNLLEEAKSSLDESQKLYNEALNLENELKEKLDKTKASIDENINNNESYKKLKEKVENLNKEIDLKTKEVEEKQKELENRPAYDPRGIEKYEKKLEESIADLNEKKDALSKLADEYYDNLSIYLNAKVNYEEQEGDLLADINHPEFLEGVQRNYKKELAKLEEDYKNLVNSNKDYIESKNQLDQISSEYKKSVRKIEFLNNLKEYGGPNKDYVNNKIKEVEKKLAYLERLDLNYLIKNPSEKDEYLYLNKQVDELKDLINKSDLNKEKIKNINENISKLEKDLENLNNIYDALLKSMNDLEDKLNIPKYKTLVNDRNRLTDIEKKSVKESILGANKEKLKDADIKVDDNGKTTVKFNDGKVEVIKAQDLIKESEYDLGKEALAYPIESKPIEKNIADTLTKQEILEAIKVIGLSENNYKVNINEGQVIPTTDKAGDFIVDVSIEFKDGTKEDAQVWIIVNEDIDLGTDKEENPSIEDENKQDLGINDKSETDKENKPSRSEEEKPEINEKDKTDNGGENTEKDKVITGNGEKTSEEDNKSKENNHRKKISNKDIRRDFKIKSSKLKTTKEKTSQNTNVKTGVASLAGVLGTLAAAVTGLFASKKKNKED